MTIKTVTINQAIKEIFRYLEDNSHKMKLSQIRFIESLKKYFKKEKKLSDKQLYILYEIRDYLQIETLINKEA